MTVNLHTRRNRDLEKRSKNGTYVYAAIWAVIGIGTNFYEQVPLLFYSILCAFICFGLVRFLTFLFTSKSNSVNARLWTCLIYFNAIMPTLLLSSLLSVSLLHPLFEPLFLFLLLSVFGVLSGGIVNFSPRPDVSLAYVLTTILPPFFTLLLIADGRFMEAILLVLYGTYMLLLSRGLNHEYTLLTTQQIELEKLNQQDSLTMIANRRSFDHILKENWALQSRTNGKISLMLIDIDYFKRINDQYGHLAGDLVIQQVAETIKRVCRRVSDVVARIGGEEFAVIISATNHEEIVHLAERLRVSVSNEPIKYKQQSLNVTVSLGVATLSPNSSNTESELFELADKRLYCAKESGRNTTIHQD